MDKWENLKEYVKTCIATEEKIEQACIFLDDSKDCANRIKIYENILYMMVLYEDNEKAEKN